MRKAATPIPFLAWKQSSLQGMPWIWEAAEGTPHPSTTFKYNSKTKNSAAISGSLVVQIRKYLQAEAGGTLYKKAFSRDRVLIINTSFEENREEVHLRIKSEAVLQIILNYAWWMHSALSSFQTAQTFPCDNLFQMKQLIFPVSTKEKWKKGDKSCPPKQITLCYLMINQYETFTQHLTFSYLLSSLIQKGK